MFAKLSKVPVLYWILIGFLVSYGIIFIQPTFLNDNHQYFSPPGLSVAINPIGVDLQWILHYSRSWMEPGAIHTGYTPLTTALFIPLTIPSVPDTYAIITLSSLASFIFITLIFPHWFSQHKGVAPLLTGLLMVGVFSYGFYFELERGQFNIIAMAFCVLGIGLFRTQPRWRWLAYTCFTIAVQLKLFPLIFIVFLVDNWRAWRANLLRFIGLGIANFALLFVLGVPMFNGFLQSLQVSVGKPYLWVGNHSIVSYLSYTLRIDDIAHFTFVEIALLLALGLLTSFFWVYRRKSLLNEATLFLVSLIVALLIPSLSHDYKLSILGMGVGVFLVCFTEETHWATLTPRQQVGHGVGVFLIMAAYTVTLFSYDLKPTILDNNLPILLLIMWLALAMNASLQQGSVLRTVIWLVFGWLMLRFIVMIFVKDTILENCRQLPRITEANTHICFAYNAVLADE